MGEMEVGVGGGDRAGAECFVQRGTGPVLP